ncbi:MAG: DUF1835 domain-containing protein [Verrucomicrobiota bacterium]
MLHVHCGDASAEMLRKGGVKGEVIVWSDPLFTGPILPKAPAEKWRAARAKHLSDSTRRALKRKQAADWLLKQDQALEKFRDYDEVVLWFDACLFDQVILIRQLDWFARRELGKTALCLICPGEFPGFAKPPGLGELLPKQLATLVETRHRVTQAETKLAQEAWAAFGSPDPTAIEKLLARDCSALPFLAEALKRHLEQFPSARNGLNRLQHEALDVVAAGHNKLVNIFVYVDHREERPFFGDTIVWVCLDSMANGEHPLLHVDGPGPLPLWSPPKKLGPWTVDITAAGRRVLAGKADWVQLNGIDAWLGGVHLQKGNVWRWDSENRCLVKPA